MVFFSIFKKYLQVRHRHRYSHAVVLLSPSTVTADHCPFPTAPHQRQGKLRLYQYDGTRGSSQVSPRVLWVKKKIFHFLFILWSNNVVSLKKLNYIYIDWLICFNFFKKYFRRTRIGLPGQLAHRFSRFTTQRQHNDEKDDREPAGRGKFSVPRQPKNALLQLRWDTVQNTKHSSETL